MAVSLLGSRRFVSSESVSSVSSETSRDQPSAVLKDGVCVLPRDKISDDRLAVRLGGVRLTIGSAEMSEVLLYEEDGDVVWMVRGPAMIRSSQGAPHRAAI